MKTYKETPMGKYCMKSILQISVLITLMYVFWILAGDVIEKDYFAISEVIIGDLSEWKFE